MVYNCFNFHRVKPLISTTEKKRLLCGSTNGEVLTDERFNECFKAGTFYNIDPKTRKPAKKNPR